MQVEEKKIKVFVAEDIDILREDLAETIDAQEDMQVVGTAGSGAEAYAYLKQKAPDVVLMDIEMEEINSGILVAEQIREFRPEQKIIFLTAHETDQMVVTAIGAGAADYIVKGIPDAEVLRHIRAVYEGDAMLDSRFQKIVMRECSRARRSEQSLLFFINNLSALTTAERGLIRLLLDGKKTSEIAGIRCVELVTVKTQLKSLMRKCGCSRAKEIVRMIHDLNLEYLF